MVNTKKKVGGMSFFRSKSSNGTLKKRNAAPAVSKSYSANKLKKTVGRSIENSKSNISQYMGRKGRSIVRNIRDGYVTAGRTRKNAGKFLSRSIRNSTGPRVLKTKFGMERASAPMDAIFRRYYDKRWYDNKRINKFKSDYIKMLQILPPNKKEIIQKKMKKFDLKYYYHKKYAKDSKDALNDLRNIAKELLPILNDAQDNYINTIRKAKNNVVKVKRNTQNNKISNDYNKAAKKRKSRRAIDNKYAVISERANSFVNALKKIKPELKNGEKDKAEKNLSLIQSANKWINDNKTKSGAEAGVKKVSSELDKAILSLKSALQYANEIANLNNEDSSYIDNIRRELNAVHPSPLNENNIEEEKEEMDDEWRNGNIITNTDESPMQYPKTKITNQEEGVVQLPTKSSANEGEDEDIEHVPNLSRLGLESPDNVLSQENDNFFDPQTDPVNRDDVEAAAADFGKAT